MILTFLACGEPAPLASAPASPEVVEASAGALEAPVAAPSATPPPPGPAAPPQPELPPCDSPLRSFAWSWASGPVGPGHAQSHALEGRAEGDTFSLRYSWVGDLRAPGGPGQGSLEWSGPAPDPAALAALLAEPLRVPRPVHPHHTGGVEERLTLAHQGGCTRRGEPPVERWLGLARELRRLAGAGLTLEEKIAYGLSSDRVLVTLSGAAEAVPVEVRCPDGGGARATTRGGRASVGPLRGDGCTLRLPTLGARLDGVGRGDRVSCEVTGATATCSSAGADSAAAGGGG